jgi:hypothetical protein
LAKLLSIRAIQLNECEKDRFIRTGKRQLPGFEDRRALRSDLAPEQRAGALRIGRIGFASAGAKRRPKETIAA